MKEEISRSSIIIYTLYMVYNSVSICNITEPPQEPMNINSIRRTNCDLLARSHDSKVHYAPALNHKPVVKF